MYVDSNMVLKFDFDIELIFKRSFDKKILIQFLNRDHLEDWNVVSKLILISLPFFNFFFFK